MNILTKDKLKTLDLERILSKSDRQLLSEGYPFTYLLDGRMLVVRNGENAFLFDYNNAKVKFKQRIRLSDNRGQGIYMAGNKLYFYGIYNYNKRDSKIPSGFIVYDLVTGEEKKFKILFDYLSLTHIAPNNFLDFTPGGYIVCDPLRYKLYEYDYNNSIKDSIFLPDSLFKVNDTRYFTSLFNSKDVSENPTNYLQSMSAYLDTVDHVWTVNYLDENTLFIRLTRNSLIASNKGQLFYDHIWVKSNNKWKLTQVKEIYSFRTEKTIEEKDLWPYFFPGSKYTCANGTLYYTVWSSSQNIFPQNAHSFFGFDTDNRSALSLKLIRFKVK
jgi:hypothetical protein